MSNIAVRETAIETWDYTASVERMRPMVVRWKTLTVEMLHELWEAREALSKTGAAGHVENLSGTDDPLRTWAQYCEDIGLSKRTANRWLQRYDPQGRKLIEAPDTLHEQDDEMALQRPWDELSDEAVAAGEAYCQFLERAQRRMEAEHEVESLMARKDEMRGQTRALMDAGAECLAGGSEPTMWEWLAQEHATAEAWRSLCGDYYALRDFWPQLGACGPINEGDVFPRTVEEVLSTGRTLRSLVEGEIAELERWPNLWEATA